jgi:hypothetical protein
MKLCYSNGKIEEIYVEHEEDYDFVPDDFTGIVEWNDGTKEWFQNGLCHRLDGPACEHPDGPKQWCQNGLLHREDGPAIEWDNGDKEWYQNGKQHRFDGPAVEFSSGYKECWINGKQYSEEDFNKAIKS